MLIGILECSAVVTSAAYGILKARSVGMDVLGVFVMAFCVAFAGGTLRDLFLDRHPLFWIEYSHYAMIVFGMSLASCFVKRVPKFARDGLFIPDAVGLGLFSIVGTQAALDCGTDIFIAVLMGLITGTFGGVVSDVLCARVPSLFRSAPLYATCSIIGCAVYVALRSASVPPAITSVAGIATVVVLRVLSIHRKWTLPEFSDPEEDTSI